MAQILKPLGLAALLALGAPAFAQDTTTEEAPAASTLLTEPDQGQLVEEALQEVEQYVDEVFGDWQRECLRIPGNEGPAPCQMTQFLREDADGDPVGKISVGKLPEAMEADAGSTIILPLGILLPQQLILGVDDSPAKRYAFTACEPIGCYAQFGFAAAEIEAMKAGAVANITVVAADRPDTPITIEVSLTGFTDAWNSLTRPVVAEEEAPAAQ